MAFTVTIDKSTAGNKKVHFLNVTADAAEANIETGINVITAFSIAKKSMNSANQHFQMNANSSGTAANGTIGVSGCTSGDAFCLIVYGR